MTTFIDACCKRQNGKDIYPSYSPELSAIHDLVLETLHELIGIMSQPGFQDRNKTLTQRKGLTIEHVITSATRSHPVLSPLLIERHLYNFAVCIEWIQLVSQE